MAIVPEWALGGNQLLRILEQRRSMRGLPKAIRTDNGKEFCSRAMLTWAHARGVQLFLIGPGDSNQNAYIESFNGRFRDECLNEHWFTRLQHVRAIVEAWRREYNEARPKQSLGGLTPAAYAQTLKQKAVPYLLPNQLHVIMGISVGPRYACIFSNEPAMEEFLEAYLVT